MSARAISISFAVAEAKNKGDIVNKSRSFVLFDYNYVSLPCENSVSGFNLPNAFFKSCCGNTGTIRDDPYCTSVQIKLVQFRFPPVVTLDQ